MTSTHSPATSAAPLQVETAPLWRRFAAMGYDSLILLAISMAYGALVTAIGAQLSETSEDFQPMFATGGSGELVTLGWLLTLAGFYIVFWRRSGQTVGMKAWRLQLVQADNPSCQPSLLRCSQRAAWGLLSLVMLGAGYWYRWFNASGQCLHDKLTHTQVIVLPKGH